MSRPSASVLPFRIEEGWPIAIPDCDVTLRESGLLLGSLNLEHWEWASLGAHQLVSIRIDDHPETDGWTVRHPDGSEESTKFTVPMTPVEIPGAVVGQRRTFEEWVSDVHGASGRLLIWDETLSWWCAQEPDLEATVTCAPAGRFSPYSDELSWLSFGSAPGRHEIEWLCVRYGIRIPN